VNAVSESGKSLAAFRDGQLKGVENGYAVLELGSGRYSFAVTN
jgi:hypothetical protein